MDKKTFTNRNKRTDREEGEREKKRREVRLISRNRHVRAKYGRNKKASRPKGP